MSCEEKSLEAIWDYACSFGLRNTHRLIHSSLPSCDAFHAADDPSCSSPAGPLIVTLTRDDIWCLLIRHRMAFASVVMPTVTPDEEIRSEEILNSLQRRIDICLEVSEGHQASSSSSSGSVAHTLRRRWFVKTNRHSPKDSPLDSPTPHDMELFRAELMRDGLCSPPPRTQSVDAIDFGGVFRCVLRSRLLSLAAVNGEESLSPHPIKAHLR
jgi:hypothetical protein